MKIILPLIDCDITVIIKTSVTLHTGYIQYNQRLDNNVDE